MHPQELVTVLFIILYHVIIIIITLMDYYTLPEQFSMHSRELVRRHPGWYIAPICVHVRGCGTLLPMCVCVCLCVCVCVCVCVHA